MSRVADVIERLRRAGDLSPEELAAMLRGLAIEIEFSPSHAEQRFNTATTTRGHHDDIDVLRCASSITDAAPLPGRSPLERLPADVVSRIASHLPLRDRVSLSTRVSRSLARRVASSPRVAWRSIDLSPHARAVTDGVLGVMAGSGCAMMRYAERLNVWGCAALSPRGIIAAVETTAAERRALEEGGEGDGETKAISGHPPSRFTRRRHLLLGGGRGLTHIDLGRTRADGAVIAAIVSSSPNLRSIHLWNCDAIGDEEVGALGALRHLEDIDLGHCSSITDAGLIEFAAARAKGARPVRCSLLRRLVLTWCFRVTDAGVLAALGCDDSASSSPQSIDHTGINGGTVASGSAAVTRRRPTPLDLHIEGCHHVTDATVVTLSLAYSLTRLIAHGCTRLTDASLHALATRAPLSLTEANLALCKSVTGDGVHALTSACVNLTALSIEGCHDVRSGAVGRSPLPRLRKLSLAFCSQLDERSVMEAVGGAPGLQELDVRWVTAVTGKVIRAISDGCARFKRMDARWCAGITAEEAAAAPFVVEYAAVAQGSMG